jgi:hypothetical protein
MNEYKPYKDSGKLNASKSKKSDKSPDYWGDIAINLKDLNNVQVVDGLHVFKLSGWKKVSKTGNTFLSVAIDRREAEGKPTDTATPNEDIPF